MKRSEMIEVIREYLQMREEENMHRDNIDAAEYILGSIETFGMLPPYDDRRKFRNNDRMDCCKWEDESPTATEEL